MSNGVITINGVKYEGEIFCHEGIEEPTPEQLAPLAESYSESDAFGTDIFYYVPDSQKLCRASVSLPTNVLSSFPVKGPGEASIEADAKAKVLKVDIKGTERRIGKIEIDAEDEEVRKQVAKALSTMGLTQGGKAMGQLEESYEMLRLRLIEQKHLAVKISFSKNADDPDKLTVSVYARRIPASVTLRELPHPEEKDIPGRAEIQGFEMEALEDEINRLLAGDPAKLAGVLSGSRALARELKDSDVAQALRFAPAIHDFEVKDGRLVLTISGWERPKRIWAQWDEGFVKYIATRPEEERREALEYLKAVEKEMSKSKSMTGIYRAESLLVERAKNGWQSLEKSYLLSFRFDNRANGLAVIVSRVPMPRSIDVTGDFPEEDLSWIRAAMNRARGRGGIVDVKAADEAMEKIKARYVEQGFKIKELSYELDHEGTLRLQLDLRRWDDVLSVHVVGEKEDDEESKKRAAVLAEVMEKFRGKFIREEDLAAAKRMLARGIRRSDIREVITTDTESGKTKVTFIASEAELDYYFTGGGGIDGTGLSLTGSFHLVDDGKGTSLDVAYTNQSRWRFFKSWSVKDIYHQSLYLGVATPVAHDQKISVAVYGSLSSWEGQEMKKLGADVTHHTYFLNDRLVLSFGGAVELIDAPEDTEGYTGVPVRARPHAGVCYREGDMKVCLNSSLTAGATNYSSNGITVSYSVPLAEGNAPYVIFKGAGGFQIGDVPLLEQSTQADTGVPFAFSILGGDIHFGTHYAGASAALGYNVTSWFSVKPLVASILTVGKHAKAVVGSCLALGPIEACLGYRKGIRNSKDGLDFSIGSADGIEVPEPIRRFFETLFLREKMEF